jgi:colanic acid/amylovoran biosynthesis glycosyltransferase
MSDPSTSQFMSPPSIQPATERTSVIPPMRLAYLTTIYPAVSHTFIRREILEIERRGHEVHRFAIRASASPVVDPGDLSELSKTLHLLGSGGKSWLLSVALSSGLKSPVAFLRALRADKQMSKRSERGLVQHAAYLVEAAFLLQELRARHVQHMHVHFGTNAASVALLARTLGGPDSPTYSFTVHGPDEFDQAIGHSLREKIDAAAFVCAISDFGAAQLKRWAPLDQWGKIHVIRCSVGESFFSAGRAIDPDSRSLVTVGRLSPQKGHLVLIEAFAQAIREGLEAKLVLVGDGELRGETERRIATHKLQGRVELTGSLGEAQVRERILASRAMVLPSFAEGLPMVFMESLALRRPVISTFVAGIPELVEPGVTGWLVPAGRSDRLALAITQAMRTPLDQLNIMGDAGWRAVHDRHNTITEGDKLESLFASVVAKLAHSK